MKKYILTIFLFLFSLCLVFAAPEFITAEYIYLETYGLNTNESVEGIDGYLKGLLVDSSCYDIRIGDTDVLIHGKLSAEGEQYRLNVLVTDFVEGRELRSASAILLSLDTYEYAVKKIVLQLEGQETVTSEENRLDFHYSVDEINLPSISDSDYLEELAVLLQQELIKGEQLVQNGQYDLAENHYRDFLDRFENLSGDYQDELWDFYYLAEEKLIIVEDFHVLSRVQTMMHQAEDLIAAQNFEAALALYEQILDVELDKAPGEIEEIYNAYDIVLELYDRMYDLCEEYLYARFEELEFQASYYGFREDWSSFKQSFTDFHNYADSSVFRDDIKREYNNLVSNYEDQVINLPWL